MTHRLYPRLAWQGIINVGFIGRIIETIVKDTLKFFNERFLSTHETGKPFHIVGNIETVIPGTSFMKTGIRFKILSLSRIER